MPSQATLFPQTYAYLGIYSNHRMMYDAVTENYLMIMKCNVSESYRFWLFDFEYISWLFLQQANQPKTFSDHLGAGNISVTNVADGISVSTPRAVPCLPGNIFSSGDTSIPGNYSECTA